MSFGFLRCLFFDIRHFTVLVLDLASLRAHTVLVLVVKQLRIFPRDRVLVKHFLKASLDLCLLLMAVAIRKRRVEALAVVFAVRTHIQVIQLDQLLVFTRNSENGKVRRLDPARDEGLTF